MEIKYRSQEVKLFVLVKPTGYLPHIQDSEKKMNIHICFSNLTQTGTVASCQL
jgi:hypothetical protein